MTNEEWEALILEVQRMVERILHPRDVGAGGVKSLRPDAAEASRTNSWDSETTPSGEFVTSYDDGYGEEP